MIFVSTCNEISKAGVLLVCKSPHMFSVLRPPWERLGCERHVARPCQEISDLLSRTELHIVLGLNAYQNLSEIVSLLAGQCVSMFQVLRVEKGVGGFRSFEMARIASGRRRLAPRILLTRWLRS
jgi:hypothetical protein